MHVYVHMYMHTNTCEYDYMYMYIYVDMYMCLHGGTDNRPKSCVWSFRPNYTQLQRLYLAVIMGEMFRLHTGLDVQPMLCRHYGTCSHRWRPIWAGNICILSPGASNLRHSYTGRIKLRYYYSCTHRDHFSLDFIDIFYHFWLCFQFFYTPSPPSPPLLPHPHPPGLYSSKSLFFRLLQLWDDPPPPHTPVSTDIPDPHPVLCHREKWNIA